MALSAADRSKRRRQKLKREERVHVSLYLSYALHSKIKARADRNGRTLLAEIEAILTRQK